MTPTEKRIAKRLDALEAENKILALKCKGTLANNLCPDHRDKQAGKPCLACEIERLRAELATARNDTLFNEQDAVRWRKFISFDCLSLHLPILRANSIQIQIKSSTADAMDQLIDAIDCEPVLRALKDKPSVPLLTRSNNTCQRCGCAVIREFTAQETCECDEPLRAMKGTK